MDGRTHDEYAILFAHGVLEASHVKTHKRFAINEQIEQKGQSARKQEFKNESNMRQITSLTNLK